MTELNNRYPLASSTWDDEEVKVATNLLKSNELTMGAEVEKFEKEFASYIGTKFAVMFNSGSSANLGMLTALKYMQGSTIRQGDEVIVPAVSWSTTYYPVNQIGLKLKFVDIDIRTLNMDINLVEKAISSRTKVIFAVNLLGNPADLVKLQDLATKYDLILLEDNCESLGASINGKKTGSFGLAGTHSFFFSHHICTMEGGMVTTNSKKFAETLISIRAHGWTRGLNKVNSVHTKSNNDWEDLFKFVLPGYNLRPLELSGAIGQVQLRKFPKFLEARRANAQTFTHLFGKREDVIIQSETGKSSWFGFSFILKGNLKGKRSELISHFAKANIETRPIVAGNFTSNPVMRHLDFEILPNLPVAETLHSDGFFIGNHHVFLENGITHVHKVFNDFVEKIN